MKNKIVLLIIIFILIMVTCFFNYRCDFSGSWVRNVDDNEETIYFGKFGHFSYYTSEGNAVDDYDLCSFYIYNKSMGYIRLWCDSSFDGAKKLKIVNKNSKKIKISFDDEVKVFKKS